MATMLICDRCNEPIKHRNYKITIVNGWQASDKEERDLCEPCRELVHDLIWYPETFKKRFLKEIEDGTQNVIQMGQQ